MSSFVTPLIGLGIGSVASFAILYSAFFPEVVCSSVSGFKFYDRLRIAESIEQPSDVIFAIGTIKHVETRAVDWYHPVHKVVDYGNYTGLEVVGYEPSGSKIPWKFITMDVEKYLTDETGNFSEEITFRAAANACFDNTFQRIVPLRSSDPASDPDKSPKFSVGDRSFIEIHRWDDGELDATGNFKLDIDENDVIVFDPRSGIDKRLTLAELENQIMAELQEADISS